MGTRMIFLLPYCPRADTYTKSNMNILKVRLREDQEYFTSEVQSKYCLSSSIYSKFVSKPCNYLVQGDRSDWRYIYKILQLTKFMCSYILRIHGVVD